MPEKIDLSYLLFLKPEDVIKYFEAKGYQLSFDWFEVWQEQHNKVFTVAKVMKLDILQDIRNEVEKAIKEGITFEQFQKNLEPVLRSKGWWGKQLMFDNEGNLREVQLGSPARLETIYTTNLNVAYNIGHYKFAMDNLKSRPYWQYKAVMDRNTRLSHAALNDLVYPADHDFWKIYYPPNDWGCRCWVRPLTAQQVKQMGLKVEDKLPDKSTLPPPEWAYNPGRKAFKPELLRWDPDLRKIFRDDDGNKG